MSLRYRKDKENDLESGEGVDVITGDSIQLLTKLNQLQQKNRELERSLSYTQNQLYNNIKKDDDKVPNKLDNTSDIYDRARWLIGLLILQSCSSFILSSFEKLLAEHQALVYFLTMLVGAGGNAGNQACVKMIRELAIGNNTIHTIDLVIM